MEPNETLKDAVKRECKEEAGYEIEPLCLSCIEVGLVDLWFRFTFLALIKGGSLKKIEDADGESLQAAWFDVGLVSSKEFKHELRSSDILETIRLAYDNYGALCTHSFDTSRTMTGVPKILPVENPHENIKFTYLALDVTNATYLVYARHDGDKLPAVIVDIENKRTNCFHHASQSVFLKNCFKKPDSILYEIIGACHVAYTGSNSYSKEKFDGIQIAVVLSLKDNFNDLRDALKDSFKWNKFMGFDPNGSLFEQIQTRLNGKFSFINFFLH
jgi:8-oxo-dGTP pyrophosphatase MutT (NUDIX family)